MFQPNNYQSKFNTKTVVLAAECLKGFIEAGRFAANFLFDKYTRIILLNTFQHPMAATSTLRKIDLVLKQNADEDLSRVKTTLVKEYGIASENIEKLTIEGDLNTVIKTEFGDLENLSIVLDYDLSQGSYRKAITSILNSRNRPIFLISGFLTVFEESKAIIIGDKEETIKPDFLNYLTDLSVEYAIDVEIVTTDNGNSIEISPNTAVHLSRDMNALDFSTIFPENSLTR